MRIGCAGDDQAARARIGGGDRSRRELRQEALPVFRGEVAERIDFCRYRRIDGIEFTDRLSDCLVLFFGRGCCDGAGGRVGGEGDRREQLLQDWQGRRRIGLGELIDLGRERPGRVAGPLVDCLLDS